MMKKLFLIAISLFVINSNYGQISKGGDPISINFLEQTNIDKVTLQKVSQDWIDEQGEIDNRHGNIQKVAKNIPTDLNPYNSGTWETLLNGDRLWRLQITATDAIGINALFKDFALANSSKLYVYSPGYKQIIGAFDESNNDVSKLFSTEIIFGNTMIIEYLEPKNQLNKGFFTIENIGSFYKQANSGIQFGYGFGDSNSCEVNVNCNPEGNNWQDEKRGVARILVMSPNGQGWCSGTLVNNTNADCKPYFLTAYHCGNSSTVSNFNQWIFYFNYEFSGCSNSSTQPTTAQTMTGGVVKARSNNLSSGVISSDFLLLELNQNVPASYNVYYNGWTNANVAPSSGVSIHHPAGDVKKISHFTSTPTTVGVSWAGSGYSVISGATHWSHSWSSTTNGHGVTEGGSSGSPLFNNSGLIIGTLSGGGSYCNNTSASDQYGKMSYHWQSNAVANNRRLKPWLDPVNLGVTSLVGTYPPCTINTSDDAGITAINSPTGNVCGTSIVPEVELKNFGTTNLTSVTINSQINSGAIVAFSWTGNIAPNTTTTVSLPAVTVSAGANTYTATTNNPNGNTDGNTTNDAKSENFTVSATVSLPVQQNFETTTFPPINWQIGNSDNGKTWEHSTTIGTGTGTKSMFIDNWDYDAVGQLDWFVSQTYDFSAISNPSLTYDHAYAYYQQTGGTNISYDTLGIAVSIDCGNSFFWLWKEGGVQLATAGGLGIEFVPTASDWQNNVLDLASLVGESSVQFAFIAKNGYGNNLYIDNINILSVVIPTPPVAAFTANATNLCVGQTIAFTDQSTNTPTAWSWNFGGGATNSTMQNPVVTFNTTGSYTISLVATNADGSDTETKMNYVVVNTNPTLSLNPNNISCNGANDGMIVATANGSSGYSYAWTGTTNTNANLTNLSVGNYSCIVTDVNGCTASSGMVNITEPSPLALTINIHTAYCNNSNGSATALANGGTAPYNYVWSQGNGMNLSPGGYSISVTDAHNCTITENFVIGNTILNFNITTQTTNSACLGNTGTATATVNGSTSGYTFLWDNGQTTSQVTGLSYGIHNVEMTNSNGCSETTSFNIGNINAPSIQIQETNITCFGLNDGQATSIVSGGTPGYSYAWSTGGTLATENNLILGNHTLVVTDAASCIAEASFSISEPPAISITFSTVNEHCDQQDGEITANVIGGVNNYSYQWNNSSTNNPIDMLTAGSYAVTVKDGNNCLAQGSVSITNIAAPSVGSFTIADVSCANKNDGKVDINIIDGSGTIDNNWSNNTNNEDLLNVGGGEYTVILTDAFSCTSSDTFTIEEPSPLILSVVVLDNSPNGLSIITASAIGGTQPHNYMWNTGATTQEISNLAIGVYTITLTDGNNCTKDTTINIGNVAIVNTDVIEMVSLYPNPAKEKLVVDVSLKNNQDVSIKVVNILGQEMYSNHLGMIKNHIELINTSNYSKGIYFIEFEINNKKEMLRFLKAD